MRKVVSQTGKNRGTCQSTTQVAKVWGESSCFQIRVVLTRQCSTEIKHFPWWAVIYNQTPLCCVPTAHSCWLKKYKGFGILWMGFIQVGILNIFNVNGIHISNTKPLVCPIYIPVFDLIETVRNHVNYSLTYISNVSLSKFMKSFFFRIYHLWLTICSNWFTSLTTKYCCLQFIEIILHVQYCIDKIRYVRFLFKKQHTTTLEHVIWDGNEIRQRSMHTHLRREPSHRESVFVRAISNRCTRCHFLNSVWHFLICFWKLVLVFALTF